MSDPIDTAVNLAKNNKSRLLETGKTAAISAASNIIANNPKLSKLKKLPTTKDPELLKQQAKAEAQKLIGEKQNELQQIKEKKIEELKDKASKLGPLLALGIGLFLKLPVLDPKLLATIAFLKAQKELRELKQKVSKENLKKAKENFTYPIKPIAAPPPPPPPPLTEAAGPPPVASTDDESTEPLGTKVVSENACTITVRTVSKNLSADGARINAQNEGIRRLKSKGCVLTAATVITVVEKKTIPASGGRFTAVAEVKIEGK